MDVGLDVSAKGFIRLRMIRPTGCSKPDTDGVSSMRFQEFECSSMVSCVIVRRDHFAGRIALSSMPLLSVFVLAGHGVAVFLPLVVDLSFWW